jgi:hypothetical protein
MHGLEVLEFCNARLYNEGLSYQTEDKKSE